MSATKYVNAVKTVICDSEASILSVARVDGCGMLVKVSQASEGLVERLRVIFPLATVALTEDLVGASACAHVLFPAYEVQQRDAVSLARDMRISRVLLAGSKIFFSMAVLVLATSVASGLPP